MFCSVWKLQPLAAGRISARKERTDSAYIKKLVRLGDRQASDQNDYVEEEWFAKNALLGGAASAPDSAMMNRVRFPPTRQKLRSNRTLGLDIGWACGIDNKWRIHVAWIPMENPVLCWTMDNWRLESGDKPQAVGRFITA